MSAEIWTACQQVIGLCSPKSTKSPLSKPISSDKECNALQLKEMKVTDLQDCVNIITARRHSLKNR